jgi:hypothetical protein
MVRRRGLLAYLIGAGVAGTLLTAPYAARLAAIELIPGVTTISNVPFFLLPILWGVWNLLWAHFQPAMSIGAWGAILGVVAGIAVNLLFVAVGTWFAAVMLLPAFLAVLYSLLFRLVVGPLNEALGVENERPAIARMP